MKYITNEKGGTLLVVVGLLVASLLISMIFFDFFSTFMTKRVSQTSADSAVMAASLKAKDIYDSKLIDKAEEEMDVLKERYETLKVTADEDTTITDIIKDLEQNFYDNRSMPSDLRHWLEMDYIEVDPIQALLFFFKEDDVVDLTCHAVKDNLDDIEDAASYYAEKNGAEGDVTIKFVPDKFRIMITAEKKPSFITVDDSGFDSLKANASASIPQPENLSIECN